MSTEFQGMASLTSTTGKEYVRNAAVEAALVLMNSCIANSSHPNNIIDSMIDNDDLSKLADCIEKALNLNK
jgi:hypothetical protein